MPTALPEEKRNSLLQAVQSGEKVGDIAKKLKISRATVYKHIRDRREDEAPSSENLETLRAENAELRRILGDMLVASKLGRPINGAVDTHH
jgi:transposase-like protein